jgi:hypothetical protein
LCGRSRFLDFAILNPLAETVDLRRIRQAHAPLHNDVGGYMRGEGKKEKRVGAIAIEPTAAVH